MAGARRVLGVVDHTESTHANLILDSPSANVQVPHLCSRAPWQQCEFKRTPTPRLGGHFARPRSRGPCHEEEPAVASKARSRNAQTAYSLAAKHWVTYFRRVHRRMPGHTLAADRLALQDIVQVQVFGDKARALKLIEEIVNAPVKGDRLSPRYVAFSHWFVSGQPKRATAPTRYRARVFRECIARNVRGVA